MGLFEAVRATVQENLYEDLSFPTILNHGVDFFSKAHLYYRSFKQFKIHQNTAKNPSAGHPAVYGAALQLIGNYSSLGSSAIHFALSIKCTRDLLNQYRELGDACQKFYETLNWRYPLYHPVKWRKEKEFSQKFISPSFSLVLQVRTIGLAKQIGKVARSCYEVFWQIFKLSMSLSDARLLLNQDPGIRFEACTELAAQWNSYQSQLNHTQDYQSLIEEIENEAEIANFILAQLGIDKDFTFIVDELKKWIDPSQGLTGVLGDIYEAAEETLETFYVKGKITPLHIDLGGDHTAAPHLPSARFPPWGGGEVEVLPPTKSPKHPLTKLGGNFLKGINMILTEPMKGLGQTIGHINRLFQNKTQTSKHRSPFA